LTSHRPDTATDPGGSSFFTEDGTLTDTAETAYPQTEGDDPGTGAGDGYDELDEEFAPQPRRKLGRLTVVLAAVLVAGLGVVGGVELQKHYGTSSSSTASGFPGAAGRAGLTGGGEGGGGFAGFGGTGAGSGTGGATSTSTGSTANVPAVIGSIVSISGQTMVVKNLGGKQITVHLTDTTTITKSYATAALAAGQTVSVSGSTGADSSVTATSVTVQ
jgi:Domain of unknown function (DUF5666)